jgi:uncharacterized protein YqeY
MILMTIQEDLRAKLTAAIKARDMATANLIRMLDTKVMERRTAKGFKGEVDDALYLDVIAAYKKSMAKAKLEFEKLGERGQEKAAELQFEIDFCAAYLPEPLSEQQVREAVRAAIAELGASGPKMTGRVMGAVMKKHKGLVEAPMVKRLVGEELS